MDSRTAHRRATPCPFPDLGDPRIKACLRLPEDYRSLATSFFGSWCQGIPTCTHGSLTNILHSRSSSRTISLAHTTLSKTFSKPARVAPDSLEVRARNRSSDRLRCRVFPFIHARADQRGRSLSTASSASTVSLLPCSAAPVPPATVPIGDGPESNRRPSGCKPDALPIELRPRSCARFTPGRHLWLELAR